MNLTRPVIHRDTDILGGTPVFVGTRVPLQNLIDYLSAGDTLEDFLRSFPSVSREDATIAQSAITQTFQGTSPPGSGTDVVA